MERAHFDRFVLLVVSVVALGAVAPVSAMADPLTLDGEVGLVAITPLADLAPTLIDPTGIAYLSDQEALVIVDSEIDEEPTLFTGVNLLTTDLAFTTIIGSLAPTVDGRHEPTGLAYDESEQVLLITNDTTDAVIFDRVGPDGRYGTDDDDITVPDYTALEISDLEDVAFDVEGRAMFLLDAGRQTVYRITPGADDVFDGVSPAGDDAVSAIELAPLGIFEATGLAFVPGVESLLVTDNRTDTIREVSKSGKLVRDIDLSSLRVGATPFSPHDVTIAPASDGSGFDHLYLVDRGRDNGDPTDDIPPSIDGRVIELAVDFGDGLFLDDDESEFQEDIEWLANEGITLGCNPPVNNRFCPDDPVTRGQMAAFLTRALRLGDGGRTDAFRDDDGSVFESDIDRLAAAGVMRGCNPPDDDLVCPAEPVSRGQMAAFLVRALGLPSGQPGLFHDDDGSVFEADIEALATAGVTRGCNPPSNDLYCPEDPVTRGQMAGFLRRALG